MVQQESSGAEKRKEGEGACVCVRVCHCVRVCFGPFHRLVTEGGNLKGALSLCPDPRYQKLCARTLPLFVLSLPHTLTSRYFSLSSIQISPHTHFYFTIMKTVFALSAAAILAATASAATVNSPANLIECQPAAIQWSEAQGDVFLSVVKGKDISAAALEQFPTQSGASGSYTW